MKKSLLMLAIAGLSLSISVASCEGIGSEASAQSSGGKKGHGQKGKKGKKNGKESNAEDRNASATGNGGVRILERWDMPSELTEISGIAFVSPTTFACVQDEVGEIFLYNITARRVEKNVRFAGAGDYEGIAVVGSTAWVMRADGLLFEVKNFAGASPSVMQHATSFNTAQDIESLCFDERRNRLLLAVKGKDPVSKNYRGVYPFDLATKKMLRTPVYKIDAADGKGKNSGVQPSDIELHPRTGELYILDGPSSGLLILGSNGVEKAHLKLSKDDFPQPEGIAINTAGDLYISNEGGKGVGTILKVALAAR